VAPFFPGQFFRRGKFAPGGLNGPFRVFSPPFGSRKGNRNCRPGLPSFPGPTWVSLSGKKTLPGAGGPLLGAPFPEGFLPGPFSGPGPLGGEKGAEIETLSAGEILGLSLSGPGPKGSLLHPGSRNSPPRPGGALNCPGPFTGRVAAPVKGKKGASPFLYFGAPKAGGPFGASPYTSLFG